mgnify:CR=1 FL=1
MFFLFVASFNVPMYNVSIFFFSIYVYFLFFKQYNSCFSSYNFSHLAPFIFFFFKLLIYIEHMDATFAYLIRFTNAEKVFPWGQQGCGLERQNLEGAKKLKD